MRKIAILLTAGAALAAPATLAAQEPPAPFEVGEQQPDSEEFDQTMAMLGSMFPSEPLTAEQQGRVPQAQRIISRMMPDGTLGEMMGTTFDKLIGPIMAMTDAPAMTAVSKGTGLSAVDLGLEPEQAAQVAVLFDPAYLERNEREAAIFPALMREIVTVMEPSMRKAMSELYAIHFSQSELDGIEAFFQTEIGTTYARKSFTMSSDPRIVSAMMESMPQLMGSFAAMEAKVAAAGEGLPEPRTFADLSAAEQAKVAELTGYSVEELNAMQEPAAEVEAAEEAVAEGA